ncbi:hypothetical protein ON010_g11401 [Phytophthora cinnamomi]|nr:hypothetical protein ON010_g11401 [Phytophthora cinnamomi]
MPTRRNSTKDEAAFRGEFQKMQEALALLAASQAREHCSPVWTWEHAKPRLTTVLLQCLTVLLVIMKLLAGIIKAEKEIEAQWAAYAENAPEQDLVPGTRRVRFVLGPMTADFCGLDYTTKFSNAMPLRVANC